MYDDLKVTSNLKSLHIYSPFKSPTSPDNVMKGPDVVCTSGLNLCFHQTDFNNSKQRNLKPPCSEVIKELMQEIPQNYNNLGSSSHTSSPSFETTKGENEDKAREKCEIMMDDIVNNSFIDEVHLKPPMPTEDIERVKTSDKSFREGDEEMQDEELLGIMEITDKPKKGCTCTKSMCLKLYCECFAAGEYCDNCKCAECHNVQKYENERQKSIIRISKKNPNALNKHIKMSIGTIKDRKIDDISCNCSKSGCQKNYCECFKLGAKCGVLCKCEGCKNRAVIKA